MSWDGSRLNALQLGDKKAQEDCYLAFSPLLYTTIIKLCDNREAANDLLHDSFIDAFNSIGSFNSKYSFLAWLKRIAINNTYNYLKRQQTALRAIGSLANEPVHAKEGSESENLFNKLLYSLPTEHRIVMWLFIVEQYSHADIATFMGKSESFSKSVVSRSLNKMRRTPEVNKYGTY